MRCFEDPDVARLSLVQDDVETTFVTYATLGCAVVGHSVVLLTFVTVRCVLASSSPASVPDDN